MKALTVAFTNSLVLAQSNPAATLCWNKSGFFGPCRAVGIDAEIGSASITVLLIHFGTWMDQVLTYMYARVDPEYHRN